MATTADIQKYRRNDDGFVEYFIKVVHNGREWIVRKRYSEFSKLHEFLEKDGYTINAKFPEKVMWKKNDKKILNQRLSELQVYLAELLKTYSIAENSLLKEFLEVETTWLENALQNKETIQETLRLDRIPTLLAKWMIPMPTNPSVNAFNTPNMTNRNTFTMLSKSSKQKSMSFSLNNPTSSSGAPGGSFLLHSSSFSKNTPMRKDSMSSIFGGGDRSGGNDSIPTTPAKASDRDRKFSMDIFSLSHSFSQDQQAILQATVKKSAFTKAIDSLWDHYVNDVNRIRYREEEKDMVFFHQMKSNTSNNSGLKFNPTSSITTLLASDFDSSSRSTIDKHMQALSEFNHAFYHSKEDDLVLALFEPWTNVYVPEFTQISSTDGVSGGEEAGSSKSSTSNNNSNNSSTTAGANSRISPSTSGESLSIKS